VPSKKTGGNESRTVKILQVRFKALLTKIKEYQPDGEKIVVDEYCV